MCLRFQCLLFFLFIAIQGKGQKPEFEHLNFSENFSNQTVNAILQDSYGFMWFGTYERLLRYDGYSVRNYLNGASDLTGYQKCDVRCLLESKDKVLYAGTYHDGLFIYNRDKDTFRNLRHNKENKQSLGSDMILSMHQDRKGNIWIGTSSGLDRFDPKTEVFTHYAPFASENHFVTSIAEDREGNLWLYGGTRICRFNAAKGQCEEYIKISENQKLKNILLLQGMMLCDRDNNLWIGNKVEGLQRLNLTTKEFKKYAIQNGKLKSDLVSALFEDQEGLIWVGTDGGGLNKYNSQSDNFSVVEHDPNDVTSIGSNAIHSIYESEPGLLWIGFFSEGVDLFQKYKKRFIQYGSKGIKGKNLNNKSVLSFAESPDGKILIGTDGGGLNVFDKEKRLFAYLTEENGQACANVVKCLYVSVDTILWCGSYRKGLCRKPIRGRSLTNYRHNDQPSDNKSLHQDNVWALHESAEGDLYIGYLNGGFDVLKKKSGLIEHYSLDTLLPARKSPTVQVITLDHKKRIWMGTQNNGALCYDPVRKSFNHFIVERESGSIASDDVRDIFQDMRGNIWFATSDGLNVLQEGKEGGLKAFTVEDGLATNNIFGILEDDKGNLWLSTDKGISCFKTFEKEFLNFDTEDGVQKKGFNCGAKLKHSSGYLFFGGMEGFTMFHPDSIHINTHIPPVVISEFSIFNRAVIPGANFNGRIYLEKSVACTDEIFLNYNDNVFSIEFAALNFISPNKNKYAYRLEEFDRDWTYVNADKRYATYTNLNPGTYTFRVIASNNDDVWNKDGVALKITVLPPWWMTWWFKTVVLLISGAAVISFIYIRTGAVKSQNKMLEEAVRQQTADVMEKNQEIMLKNKLLEENNKEISRKTARILEQQDEILQQRDKLEQLNKTKDKFFSIIAHDLRNPVNALTVLSSMLNKELQPATTSEKDLIRSIDIATYRIKSLVLNLLEWAKSQTEVIKVDPVRISIARLVEENIQLHFAQAVQKEIKINASIDETLFVYADYNMTNTIVRNILSNSIKYTPKGGNVYVSAEKNGDKVSVSFRDTGIGIPDLLVDKLFNPEHSFSTRGTESETGTGLGLILTKEFVELNKGTIDVQTVPERGSNFIITLPGGIEEQAAIAKRNVVELPENEYPESTGDLNEQALIREEFKGKRILLVDDDEQVRNAVKYILSDIFEVTEAMDVKTAMELSEEISPDLVITDIIMPGETGISFCYMLKSNKITCHLPVILLTGQGSEETHLEGLKAGADAYITKPFDRKIFLTTINNLLSSLENIKIRFSSDLEILPSEVANSAYDEELLSRAIQFIESNVSNSYLNGDILSKELGISKSLLYVKLKKLTGQTVNEFMRTIRLKMSTRLLLEGKLTVAQISIEIGFNSPSYFTRSFAQHFGMSPKEFVSKHANQHKPPKL